MSVAVPGNISNLSAAGGAASLDIHHNTATPDSRFSDLLSEQIQGCLNAFELEHASQPQPADVITLPDLAATIAAPPNGIAAEAMPPPLESDADPESSTLPTGHFRYQNETGRAATPANDAMQNGEDSRDSNSNTPATPTRHAPTIVSTPQGQAIALEAVMSATASTPPREGSSAQTAATGITPHAGDISMLNPPRLPTQALAALPQFTLPAGQGNWAEEIGNRVMWMLGRAESRAELILTPPHLGKVEVSIHLNGDQGSAQFLASSQFAREALEQAMPRLRELFAQAGINLGEASVNTSAEGQTQDASPRMSAHGVRDDGSDEDAVTPPSVWSRLDNRLIDTFA